MQHQHELVVPLPPNHIPIERVNAQPPDRVFGLVGVVVDYREPKVSRGSDYTMTLKLCDKSRVDVYDGFVIRLFRRNREDLPSVLPGDVVSLSGLSRSTFGDEAGAIANQKAPLKWIVSRQTNGGIELASLPQWGRLPATIQYLAHFRHWWRVNTKSNIGTGSPATRHVNAGVGTNSVRSAGRQVSLIKDLKAQNFYDINCEIVKVFDERKYFTLYVTDYSHNPQLYNYEWQRMVKKDGGDPDELDYGTATNSYFWKGPFGRYTLQVALWDIHGEEARGLLDEGVYVNLRNLRCKNNGDGNLECNMHGDRVYADRVNFTVLENTDYRVGEIKRRQREYVKEHQDMALKHRKKMRPASEQKKYIEDEEERKIPARISREISTSSPPSMVEDEVNKFVVCTRQSHRTWPIRELLNQQRASAEAKPRTYKIIARAIAFLPPDLKRFSVPVVSEDQQTPTDTEDEGPSGRMSSSQLHETHEDGTRNDGTQWMWRFALLLQDAEGQTIRAIVEGKDAEYLLDMNAFNPYHNPQQLGKLRERLFLLWGDLEERETAKATRSHSKDGKKRRKTGNGGNNSKRYKDIRHNEKGRIMNDGTDDSSDEEEYHQPAKMFHCCLTEYFQHRDDGWRKLHRLTATHIKH